MTDIRYGVEEANVELRERHRFERIFKKRTYKYDIW